MSGVSSGFDGTGIPPSLQPPMTNVDANGVPIQKGGKESGKNVPNTQESIKHAFVYQDASLGDAFQQKHAGEEAEGEIQDGSSKKTSGPSLQDLLNDEIASGNMEGARRIVSSMVNDMITTASGPEAQFSAKFNTLSDAYKATDWDSFSSEYPNLAKYGNFDLKAVTSDMDGNPFIDSSFITSITENLMEVGNMNKGAQYIQGMLAATLMKVAWDLGVSLGQLAIDKANLEAEMHMFQAMVAFVGLGISVGATAFSLGGMAAKKLASTKLKDNAVVDKDGAEAGGSKLKTADTGTDNVSSFKEGPKIGGSREGASSAKGTGHQEGQWQKGEINEPQKPTAGSHREVDAEVSANERTGKEFKKADQKKEDIENTEQKQTLEKEEVESTKWKKTMPQEGQEGQSKAETGASTRSDAEAFLAKKGSKAKGLDKPEEGAGGGADAKGTPSEKLKEKWERIETGAGFMESMGNLFTQSGGAQQLTSAMDNIVQMIFKPQIGQVDAATERTRAQQNATKQTLDSVTQAFNESGKGVDKAYEALEKIQDANKQTFEIRRG